ncbi:MAG: mechanosensitive ion channel family protein [Melioribacteraceae bacterium]|nr:mechanosensitive ion channel family protein [Melioribacteraceae bacterium]
MKEILNINFSELIMVLIIPIGMMIYFLLKIVRVNFINSRFNKKYKNYFLLFEILVWFLFCTWSLKVIFGATEYLSFFSIAFLSIIFIWTNWFVAKDFIAGVVLKLSDNYQAGQFFRLNNIEGHIAQVNYLHLNINQDNGEIIKIPFSKILGSIHHKSFLDDKTKQYKFELSIEKKETLDETREKIRKIILLSAGVNIKKEPIITLLNSSENRWNFEIVYFILDEQYCELIENNVKSAF